MWLSPFYIMKHSSRLASIFLLWTLSACVLLQPVQTAPAPIILVTANPNASPTATPFQPIGIPSETATLVYTFTPELPTDTPLPTLEYTATTLPSPTAPAPTARTQYTLYALLDYYNHQLGVDETIRYTNQTGLIPHEMVLAAEPTCAVNQHRDIMLDGSQLNYHLNGHWLTVSLPHRLPRRADK